MLKMLNAHNAMRTVLENRRITLELALRQLAQTVGGQAPDQEEIAAFFHDFMDGYWDAFEEATSHDSDDLREIDRQILQLQEEISRALGPEHQAPTPAAWAPSAPPPSTPRRSPSAA